MTTLTESPHAGEFLISEANGYLSREAIHVALESGSYDAGRVLAEALDADITVTPAAANSGDGTVGTLSLGANAKIGGYRAVCIEPASDAGMFAVYDPDGLFIGKANVAVAFTGPINFTISDGAANFVAGDSFTLAVSRAATPGYVAYDQDAGGIPAGILFDGVEGATGGVPGVAIVRLAEVHGATLGWKSDIEAGEIAAALAHLAKRNIIARD